jgi:UDP-N-acetylglucosamine/UDP-N-acetylgalactosamine 4-epimerase
MAAVTRPSILAPTKTHPLLEGVLSALKSSPRSWFVTGAAGFIGSHLVETLLSLGQRVIGLDNFSNGTRENLEEVKASVGAAAWANFEFVQGEICDFDLCRSLCEKAQVVLHNAALGSVPRSILTPMVTSASNVTGFLSVLTASKDTGIKRFIYASSSSVYGDNTDLPKVESRLGKPLSPYAVSKVTNELYAQTFAHIFGIETVGLRYFNVFGPRQRPDGPYAAVIPRWISSLLEGRTVEVFGDGTTSRDFCYVKNVVQMNLLAAMTTERTGLNRVFNTACNHLTSLNEILARLKEMILMRHPELTLPEVRHLDPRKGDIHHSQASIDEAKRCLGYQPHYDVSLGLEETLDWYCEKLSRSPSSGRL